MTAPTIFGTCRPRDDILRGPVTDATSPPTWPIVTG